MMSLSLLQSVAGLKRTRLRFPGKREFRRLTLGLKLQDPFFSGSPTCSPALLRTLLCPTQDTLLYTYLSISLSTCLIYIYVYLSVHPSILLILFL